MDLVIKGILFGLFLAAMIGPIFFVITTETIQNGRRAGFSITLGVWISDLVIILLSYFFIRQLSEYINHPNAKIILGIVGGIIFIGIGLISLLKKIKLDEEAYTQKWGLKSMSDFLIKGILVNTINPFTFFFWLTVMSTKVFALGLSPKETFLFVGAIFLTVAVTDSIKVILAHEIRQFMKPLHILWFSRIAGVGLMAFGIYFLVYVLI
jgi:threonine/homoserine/homoserine lactone efflux protein